MADFLINPTETRDAAATSYDGFIIIKVVNAAFNFIKHWQQIRMFSNSNPPMKLFHSLSRSAWLAKQPFITLRQREWQGCKEGIPRHRGQYHWRISPRTHCESAVSWNNMIKAHTNVKYWILTYEGNYVLGFKWVIFFKSRLLKCLDYEQENITHLCCFVNNIPTSWQALW